MNNNFKSDQQQSTNLFFHRFHGHQFFPAIPVDRFRHAFPEVLVLPVNRRHHGAHGDLVTPAFHPNQQFHCHQLLQVCLNLFLY